MGSCLDPLDAGTQYPVNAPFVGSNQVLGTQMKLPAPALAIATLSLAGMLLALGVDGIQSALFLATGNLILIVWAARNQGLARDWRTVLIASAPILLLTIGCLYLFRIRNADALVALAVGFYWLVHMALLAVSFGIARAYHESAFKPRA